MSFLRSRSNSDNSPLGLGFLSPFRGFRTDPDKIQDDVSTNRPPTGFSFYPDFFVRQPSLGSCDGYVVDPLGTSTAVSESVEDLGLLSDSESSSPATEAFQSRELVYSDNAWESVPLEEINTVPDDFSDHLRDASQVNLRFGSLRSILVSYLGKALEAADLSEDRIQTLLRTRLSNRELVDLAVTHGLFPLAVRLHLVNEGSIPMHPEHSKYLETKAGKNRRRRRRESREFNVLSSSSNCIEYFPGIQLKLGKERDTVIRPMLTSVFRSNRGGFKEALNSVGLRYSELRMWKDSQLCLALHVADSFKPGIWKTATDLHSQKSSTSTKRNRID